MLNMVVAYLLPIWLMLLLLWQTLRLHLLLVSHRLLLLLPLRPPFLLLPSVLLLILHKSNLGGLMALRLPLRLLLLPLLLPVLLTYMLLPRLRLQLHMLRLVILMHLLPPTLALLLSLLLLLRLGQLLRLLGLQPLLHLQLLCLFHPLLNEVPGKSDLFVLCPLLLPLSFKGTFRCLLTLKRCLPLRLRAYHATLYL